MSWPNDYRRKTLEAPGRIERLLGQLCSRFTPQQLDTTAAVLDAFLSALEHEEEHEE